MIEGVTDSEQVNLVFRMLNFIVLGSAMSILFLRASGRLQKGLSRLGVRQYMSFLYLIFWLVIFEVYRIFYPVDLAWINLGLLSSYLGVLWGSVTLWGEEKFDRNAEPRKEYDGQNQGEEP